MSRMKSILSMYSLLALGMGMDPQMDLPSPPPPAGPSDYEEYKKILRKESRLSANERAQVAHRVERAIKQGLFPPIES